MKQFSLELERYRVRDGPNASRSMEDFGAFVIPGPCGQDLRVIASPGSLEIPWEHVSISTPRRCPNWQEMCFIKDWFWDAEEIVMQLHPPRSRWINTHPYCLHLWRPTNDAIPLPPMIAV